MDNYIDNWIKIIKDCSFDNTYKMAWAKSIIEISCEAEQTNSIVLISFEEISKKYIKYYWNQTIYFDLIQGSNLKKIPGVMKIIKEFIKEYYDKKGNCKPEKFEKIETQLNKLELMDKYQKSIKQISRILKQDVSWRFKKLGSDVIPLYDLDRKKGITYFKREELELLKTYADVLFQVINYRWTQMLETFNTSLKFL